MMYKFFYEKKRKQCVYIKNNHTIMTELGYFKLLLKPDQPFTYMSLREFKENRIVLINMTIKMGLTKAVKIHKRIFDNAEFIYTNIILKR